MSNYTAIRIVESTHLLPHLDNHLHRVSNTFGVYDNDYWNEYTKSLLPLPIIIAALGITAVIILLFSLCLRCCISCCKCAPSVSEKDGRRDTSREFFTISSLTRLFVFIALLVVISDQSIFFGNRKLNSAVSTGHDALNFLDNSFTDLTNDGQILIDLGTYLSDNATAASINGCPAAASIIPDIQDFSAEILDYYGFVQPVPGYINQAQDSVHKWGVDYKNQTVWGLYAVVMVVIIFYGLGLYCQGKLCLQYNIFLAVLLIIVLIVLCAIQMAIMMGLSDYCISPTNNALQVMDPASTNFEMFSYYATCVGSSPFQASLDSANSAIVSLQGSVDLLVASCPGNAYVANMVAEIPTIENTLSSITNTTACPPFQSQINAVLQEAICSDGFSGFFIIWVSEYLTASLLFVLTIVVSITYQYFGQFWDINRQQENDAVVLGTTVYPAFDSDQADGSYARTGNSQQASRPMSVQYGKDSYSQSGGGYV